MARREDYKIEAAVICRAGGPGFIELENENCTHLVARHFQTGRRTGWWEFAVTAPKRNDPSWHFSVWQESNPKGSWWHPLYSGDFAGLIAFLRDPTFRQEHDLPPLEDE